MHDDTFEIPRRCDADECGTCDDIARLEAYYEDIAVEDSRGVEVI